MAEPYAGSICCIPSQARVSGFRRATRNAEIVIVYDLGALGALTKRSKPPLYKTPAISRFQGEQGHAATFGIYLPVSDTVPGVFVDLIKADFLSLAARWK